MSRRNALLEWLEQTKKLSKSKDYACLDLIDKIFEISSFIDRKILIRHREIFDDVCERYHKPNPADFINRRKVDRNKMVEKICAPPKNCPVREYPRKCPLTREGIILLNKFIESCILQAETAAKDILWQWFEIIDFMFERPELINPSMIDGYVEEKINKVCKIHRKNNPLSNGMRTKFGKFWKDDNGAWKEERRKRF